jgi:hypothetical protein
MNTHTQSDGRELVLFMDIFETAESDLLFPKNNFAGGYILCALLNSKLQAAGQLLRPMVLAGCLNHNIACGAVRDVFESARIVHATLEMLDLSDFARIYRFDASELIYRSLFPACGEAIKFEHFQNRLNGIQSSAAPVIARLQEFIRLQKGK